MRSRFTLLIICSLCILLSPLSALAQRGRGARGNTAGPPAAPAPARDLSGIWSIRGGSLAFTNDNPPPMTPYGKALFDGSKPSYGPRAIPPALGNDPAGHCDPLGVPRILIFGRPLEFIQTSDRVLMHFMRSGTYREIWTNGKQLPKDPDPILDVFGGWMGYAVGKWEDDHTFVVDSIGFDERTWLDRNGNRHTDQMRLREQWRRVDHDTLQLTLTINDPKMYTQPWVSDTKTFKLEPITELQPEFCVPSEEESFNSRVRNPAGGVTAK